MRKIIDSNQIASEALESFLSSSPANQAVLTDYVAMEAYQSAGQGVFRSFGVLGKYPRQVLILKNTQTVCGLSGRGRGLQKRLIDARQSREFPTYIANLRKAERGDERYLQAVAEHRRLAAAHLDRMRADAQTTAAVIRDIYNLYSKEERSALRKGEGYPLGTIQKVVRQIFEVTGQSFSDHPRVDQLPEYAELANTFIFRYSLCNYLLVLDWISHGGFKDAKPEKLANDAVDMIFVAYATYFDGLLTADGKVARLHQEVRLWLSGVFECQLPGGYTCEGPVPGPSNAFKSKPLRDSA